jgi:hypothetical protein
LPKAIKSCLAIESCIRQIRVTFGHWELLKAILSCLRLLRVA